MVPTQPILGGKYSGQPDGLAAGEQTSGGVLGTVRGAVGKIFGSDTLISRFDQHGLSADQIQRFIPQVQEFLKGKVPENVMNQISGLLPTPQEAAHQGTCFLRAVDDIDR